MRNLIKCYDTNGKTLDRYTIAYLKNKMGTKIYECLACSENLGIAQHTSCMLGRHLGKAIDFSELPTAANNPTNKPI